MIVYTLALQDACFYVGRAKNASELETRVAQHMAGDGSEWTKMHTALALVHQIDDAKTTDEDSRVIELMAKYGVEHVRGGSFCTPILSEAEIKFLGKMVDSARGTCYTCHSTQHCTNECPRNMAKSEAKGGDWICPDCENIVFASKTECRCGKWKPKEYKRAGQEPGFKPGDWKCSNCGDHQFSKNLICRKCGNPKSTANKRPAPEDSDASAVERKAPRPSPPESKVKKGDWTCVGCDFDNFASRQACFKCHKARPAPDAAPVASCVVCLDKPVRVLIQPCRHLCLCENCATALTTQQCPMCRQAITAKETVFQ